MSAADERGGGRVPGYDCEICGYSRIRAREIKHHLKTFHKIAGEYNRFIRNVVIIQRRRGRLPSSVSGGNGGTTEKKGGAVNEIDR